MLGQNTQSGSILSTTQAILFWNQHFRRLHVDHVMISARSETEYNNAAQLAGYSIKKKKDRAKKRK